MTWKPTDNHISKLAEHIWETTGNTDDKANWFAAKAQLENFAAISEIINVCVKDNYSYSYDVNSDIIIPNYVIFGDYDDVVAQKESQIEEYDDLEQRKQIFFAIETQNMEQLKEFATQDIGMYFPRSFVNEIFTDEQIQSFKVPICGTVDFSPLQHANTIGWFDGFKFLIDHNIGCLIQGQGLEIVPKAVCDHIKNCTDSDIEMFRKKH